MDRVTIDHAGVGLKLFWDFSKQYIRRYFWWYLFGVLCIVITQSLMVSIVEQAKRAIDAVVAQGATRDTVLPFALHILLVAPIVVLIRTASRLLIFTPGRLAEYHIRNTYYANLLYQQRDFFAKHDTGDLVSRCSNDIGFIRGAFGFGFLQVANVSITLVLAVSFMLNMDIKTTVLIAIPMMISFAIIQMSIHYMFSFWRQANVQLGELSSLCLAAYKGVTAIQNYHAEPEVEQRFYERNRVYLDTLQVITRTRSFAIPLVQMVGYTGIFLVIWFGGMKVIQGNLSMGEVAAFVGYINMVMPPLLSLGWMLNVFNRALPAIERLNEILFAEVKLPAVVEGAARLEGKIQMTARNLGCRFPGDELGKGFQLRDIDFDLPPGKVLGIVGPLGSGKTALLETLVRLNSLEPGRLFVNQVDAARMDLSDFRAHLSFIPQKALLFSTSLRNNLQIALPEGGGDPEEDGHLLSALECAGFDLDPKQFPHGLETQVGEKGVMLSGGQRQRIALARALLKRADIFLLDDVLSAVDHETEKRIITNIRRFAHGKSLIIASHRVSAIQWVDEILVLENGSISCRGTHEQLIDRDGFYRDIYNYQSQKMDEA